MQRKVLTVAQLIEQLQEYEGQDEPVIFKDDTGYEYQITEIDQNGHQFDLDDEDSFQDCCFLYGYIDP